MAADRIRSKIERIGGDGRRLGRDEPALRIVLIRRGRQVLEPDISELHLHRPAHVQLQGDHAREPAVRRIVIDDFQHLLAVLRELDAVADGANARLVPVVPAMDRP